MEPFTITVLVIVSALIVPAFVALCVDRKDSESSEPKLKSHRKKGSQSETKKSVKSRESSKRQNKSGSVKEPVTVIANGNAGSTHNDVTPRTSAHGDPEAHAPKEINEALVNGGSASPKASIVNETSPSSSQRSSRASGGQPRVVSQDRALPEIPLGQPARLSVNSERSPSTKRALPELPSAVPPTIPSTSTATAAEEEGANHYDQLERDLPPHQIKSKSSESSSVKVQMRFTIDEEGSASSDGLIEPDEVTRSSVFMSTDPREVYSSVTNESSEATTKSDERASLKPLEVSKTKARAPYSKIRKDGVNSELKSPGSESVTAIGDHAEPVYQDPPPVPLKMYGVDNDFSSGEADGAVGAGAVALVIDNNAQDSGSGYYAVTDDGPAANMVVPPPHANVPESYDILTARESIASVRARQGFGVEEDYYESMDDKQEEQPSAAADAQVDGSGATELYAEIDNQQPAAPAIAASTSRPPVNEEDAPKEELYAEIDTPQVSTNQLHPVRPVAPINSHHSDSGYEKVDFAGPKGEKMDSAGYAIVKESRGAAAANNLANDDEEDYAVCDPIPTNGAHHVPAAIINEQLSRHASDVSDYATVSYSNDDGQAAGPQQNAQQSPAINNEERPFQRYPRREPVYQEIDEVGREETPPDKKN